MQIEPLRPQFKKSLLNQQSESKIRFKLESKNKLFVILVLSISLFIILAVLGESEFLVARYFFGLLGPFLGFLGYLMIVFILFFKSINDNDAFQEIFAFTIISGTVAVIFAITLNNSAIIATFTFFAFVFPNLNPETILVVIFAIVTPFMEEVAKIIPVFVLSRGMFTYWGKRERRLFHRFSSVMLSAVIVGGIFTMLETYWYTFNSGFMFSLDNIDDWQSTYGQIMIRTLSPLHIATTGLMGMGIAHSLYSTNRDTLKITNYYPFLLSFIGAFIFHGMWNGTLVIASFRETIIVSLFHTELPLLNVIYGIIAFGSLGVFYIVSRKYVDSVCNFCGSFHVPPFSKESHSAGSVFSNSIFDKSISNVFKPLHSLDYCINCNHPIKTGKLCENCNSVNVFICKNCENVVPVYANECWSCDFTLTPGFDDTLDYPVSTTTYIAIGMMKLLAGFYVPLSIALIIFSFIVSIAPEIVVRFIFIQFLGLGYIVAIYWLNSPKYKSLGISLSRTFFAIFAIQFGFTLAILANVFFLLSPIVFLLYILEVIVVFWVAAKSLIEYRPIVHGGLSSV